MWKRNLFDSIEKAMLHERKLLKEKKPFPLPLLPGKGYHLKKEKKVLVQPWDLLSASNIVKHRVRQNILSRWPTPG
jgi:hypothetical protein